MQAAAGAGDAPGIQMISPTFTRPAAVQGTGPVTESRPVSPRGSLPDIRKRPHAPAPPAIVPPPLSEGLAGFLYRPCLEVAVNQELEPEIQAANLRDSATFDAVLRRSRGALLAAVDAAHPGSAKFQAALDTLDRSAALRSHSHIVRHALYQG
jgi:hypothetical protein